MHCNCWQKHSVASGNIYGNQTKEGATLLSIYVGLLFVVPIFIHEVFRGAGRGRVVIAWCAFSHYRSFKVMAHFTVQKGSSFHVDNGGCYQLRARGRQVAFHVQYMVFVISENVCQKLTECLWFSPSTSLYSTYNMSHFDIFYIPIVHFQTPEQIVSLIDFRYM